MTNAARDMFAIIDRLDKIKEFHSSVKGRNINSYIKDNTFSAFVLFYVLNNYSGDIHDVTMQSINYFDCSEMQKSKMKILATAFTNNAIWTNIFVFNAFACAVNNKDFKPGIAEDITAKEIVWAIINIAAIEGSINLPFTHDVMVAIVGWLKIDGWVEPPLFLKIHKFLEFFDSKTGHTPIADSMNLDSLLKFNGKPGSIPDADFNSILLNKDIAGYIKSKINKLSLDWELAVKKEI